MEIETMFERELEEMFEDIKSTSEYIRLSAITVNAEDAMVKSFNEEQYKLFSQFFDAYVEEDYLCRKEFYAKGFKKAVTLIMEGLKR